MLHTCVIKVHNNSKGQNISTKTTCIYIHVYWNHLYISLGIRHTILFMTVDTTSKNRFLIFCYIETKINKYLPESLKFNIEKWNYFFQKVILHVYLCGINSFISFCLIRFFFS